MKIMEGNHAPARFPLSEALAGQLLATKLQMAEERAASAKAAETDLATELVAAEQQAISRIRKAVEEATELSGWWATPAGHAANKCLTAWGAVERERRITGDPSACPKRLAGSWTGGSTNDSMPGVVMAHATVEMWMRSIKPLQRRLLRFYYLDGMEDKVIAMLYILPNGSTSDPCLALDAVPSAYLAYERVATVAEARVHTVKLADFPGFLTLRPILDFFGLPWPEFLEAIHQKLGENLANRLEK